MKDRKKMIKEVYVIMGSYDYESSTVLGVCLSQEDAKKLVQNRYDKENKNGLVLEWENRNPNYLNVICSSNLDNDSLDYDIFIIEKFEIKN